MRVSLLIMVLETMIKEGFFYGKKPDQKNS